jgi:hypothetical protein
LVVPEEAETYMTTHRKYFLKRSFLYFLLMLLAGFALVVCFLLVTYQPDKPVATIVPGSSSRPSFIVQVIRPRMGLPIGGLLPPGLFGVDAQLGFNSTSDGATIGSVGSGEIELAADNWELRLVRDGEGRITSETEVIFDLIFEDRIRRVRCRPSDPVVGTLNTVALEESGEISGSFDIELHCEDAETGTPLGWPSKPLILHGSFDRLPLDSDTH